ncbi:MAG: AAA family ATPase [Candidatus Bathyarchaeia archaeon]|nr:AAA family ATPase [Candidatus Bathyarchaeota archaeon]
MKKIIAIVGMPGSGKSLISEAAINLNFPVYSCGDVIREEAIKNNLSLTHENLSKIMIEIRKKNGEAAVVKKIIPKIMNNEGNIIVVEGIRSRAELEELKKYFNVKVLAVHASPKVRFERLKTRGRSDDPKTYMEFSLRDEKELKLGIGEAIALADKMLINEDSIEKFFYMALNVLKEIERDE